MKKRIREIVKVFGLIIFGLIIAWLLRCFSHYHFISIPERSYAYVIVFVGWMILLFPAGELIGLYLSKFRPKKYEELSLDNSGKFIGWLERTIILVFYLGGSLEGIAFLVVAKTIYRFGALSGYESENKNSKKYGKEEDSKFAISQYIILGSFLSYTIAVLGGVLINLLLQNLGLSLSPLL